MFLFIKGYLCSVFENKNCIVLCSAKKFACSVNQYAFLKNSRFIICSGNKIALILCLEIKWVVLHSENPIIPLSIVNFLNYKIVLFLTSLNYLCSIIKNIACFFLLEMR